MHTVSKVPTYPLLFEYWWWKGIQNQCRRMTRRGLSASFAFPLTTSLSEPSFCAGCTSTWTLEWRREREAAKSERDDKTIDGPDRRRTMNGQPENPRSGGVESKNPSSGGNEGDGESEADSKRCGQKAAVFLGLFFTAFCYCPYLHTERQGQFGSRVHLHSASLRFTLHPKEIQWGGSSADSPAPKPKKKKISVKRQTSDSGGENLFSNGMNIWWAVVYLFRPRNELQQIFGAPKMQQAKANKGKEQGIQVSSEWEHIAKSGRCNGRTIYLPCEPWMLLKTSTYICLRSNTLIG